MPQETTVKRLLTLTCLVLAGFCGQVRAAGVTGAQRAAASEFLAAVASGNAQNIGYAIHPAELEELRTRLLGLLREEAQRGDSALRVRLFGPGLMLAELERYTAVTFYGALSRRLTLRGRQYEDAVWLAAIPDQKSVHVLLRGKQPKDRGAVQVVNVVTLLPYGKDWKAAIPSEVQAQIDDLVEGRTGEASPPPAASSAGSSAQAANVPGILLLLDGADKALVDGRCDDYYERYLSPNFRKVTAKKAIETLVKSCANSIGMRETLLTTLRIVRNTRPRYEYAGTRAVYDLGGQGLPFDHFVLERIDDRWYIAE
jgi:hypothetical protein